ncbi:MAG: methyltransferase [Bacteroidota bacterium]|jgi:protein-S-isoprenylcysteine O-methyltransferase Ste14
MTSSFVIPAVLFVVCLAIRSVYELLKEAQKINPENKVIFVLIFSSMCTLWVSWFILCPADPLRVEVPSPVRWLGLAIFVFGTILAVGALIQLRGVENIDHLVTNGLFKKLRHPMYLGFISWIVGWSIYYSAMASLGIGVLGIASVLWWRRLEDARLEVQFGNRYHEYRPTTWF